MNNCDLKSSSLLNYENTENILPGEAFPPADCSKEENDTPCGNSYKRSLNESFPEESTSSNYYSTPSSKRRKFESPSQSPSHDDLSFLDDINVDEIIGWFNSCENTTGNKFGNNHIENLIKATTEESHDNFGNKRNDTNIYPNNDIIRARKEEIRDNIDNDMNRSNTYFNYDIANIMNKDSCNGVDNEIQNSNIHHINYATRITAQDNYNNNSNEMEGCATYPNSDKTDNNIHCETNTTLNNEAISVKMLETDIIGYEIKTATSDNENKHKNETENANTKKITRIVFNIKSIKKSAQKNMLKKCNENVKSKSKSTSNVETPNAIFLLNNNKKSHNNEHTHFIRNNESEFKGEIITKHKSDEGIRNVTNNSNLVPPHVNSLNVDDVNVTHINFCQINNSAQKEYIHMKTCNFGKVNEPFLQGTKTNENGSKIDIKSHEHHEKVTCKNKIEKKPLPGLNNTKIGDKSQENNLSQYQKTNDDFKIYCPLQFLLNKICNIKKSNVSDFQNYDSQSQNLTEDIIQTLVPFKEMSQNIVDNLYNIEKNNSEIITPPPQSTPNSSIEDLPLISVNTNSETEPTFKYYSQSECIYTTNEYKNTKKIEEKNNNEQASTNDTICKIDKKSEKAINSCKTNTKRQYCGTEHNDSPKSTKKVLSNCDDMLSNILQNQMNTYFKKNYLVLHIIHHGQFSKLFKCQDDLGRIYTVKMLRRVTNKHAFEYDKIIKKIQTDIPKQNLFSIYLVDSFTLDNKFWCYLMEYYPKNLKEAMMEKKSPFNIDAVQILARQLIAAVSLLRCKNIVHADINPNHILLNDSNKKLKLCGFDKSYSIESVKLLPNLGIPSYRAPEVIIGHSAGYSIDVWATALVMHEMFTGVKLFQGIYNNTVLYKQMVALGNIPYSMIKCSYYKKKHFVGKSFQRILGPKGKGSVLIDSFIASDQILSSVQEAYNKYWRSDRNKGDQELDNDKIRLFNKLLKQMLRLHPAYRLPIEFVYANPFVNNSYE